MPKNGHLFLVVVLFSFAIEQGVSYAAEDASIAPSASMNERVLQVPGDPKRPITM